MIKRFATEHPKLASGLIYTAGYVGGSLLGFLAGYLISGTWKSGATAIGMGCGLLALAAAQRKGLVPKPEELNKPLTLFGSGGFHGEKEK
jgi:hypothetical protein